MLFILVCCTAVKRACNLPVVEGFGKAVLSRWYYNKRDQNCQKFLYRGVGGNQNSYLTHDECINACPAFDNPCSGGHPLMVAGEPKICSPAHRCPSTHFCHLSVESIPNYCCPKNGDPCEHPLSVGIGPYSIPRLYYNKDSRRCAEFVYKGSKGNANNFLSMEDCELVCQVAVKNPCQSGHPLVDEASSEPVICGGEQQCPSGYWCHVGGAPETTNCCPGTRKACDLPLEVGVGSDRLDRWYFDGGAQICRQFIYAGLRGNPNNFLTREACQKTCPEFNPCLHGEPISDEKTRERKLCKVDDPSSDSSCPSSSHYCHVGASFSSTLCCLRSGLETCELPLNYGMGSESLPRWYYNSMLQRCEPFQYSGSRGNENNFLTKAACEKTCPSHRNYCPHGDPLMDDVHNKPVACGILKGCAEGYVCHMNAEHDVSICCQSPTNFCLQARETGPCEGDEARFGYNPLTDSCVAYKYGGCEGTLNNFKSLEKCTEICCREYKRLREDHRHPLVGA